MRLLTIGTFIALAQMNVLPVHHKVCLRKVSSSNIYYFHELIYECPKAADNLIKTHEEVTVDDDKYNIEYIPVHWGQFWVDTKSFPHISPTETNLTMELPFSSNFHGHIVSKIFIFLSRHILTTIEDDEHTTKYIAPIMTVTFRARIWSSSLTKFTHQYL